jgi:hypothetical protein
MIRYSQWSLLQELDILRVVKSSSMVALLRGSLRPPMQPTSIFPLACQLEPNELRRYKVWSVIVA